MEPGLLPHPLQLEARVRPHPDGGRLRRPHRLLHRLVELLGVEDEHVHGLGVLLGVDGGRHHGGLHRGHHPQLRAKGRDLLTNLTQNYIL